MTPAPASPPVPPAVPIRTLGTGHRDQIAAHLQALEPADRYLRFGYAASDEQIRRYVDQLDFERDELFGIFNRRLHLIAMAHLAFSVDPELKTCAEFGVSVARARGPWLISITLSASKMASSTSCVIMNTVCPVAFTICSNSS